MSLILNLTNENVFSQKNTGLCNPVRNKYCKLNKTFLSILNFNYLSLLLNSTYENGFLQEIAGWCSAVLTFMGLIGGIPIGNHVDRRKQFSSTLKICYGCVVVGLAIVAGVRFLLLYNKLNLFLFIKVNF